MPQYIYAIVIIDGKKKVIKSKGCSGVVEINSTKRELERDLKAAGIKYSYMGISEHPPTTADLDSSKRGRYNFHWNRVKPNQYKSSDGNYEIIKSQYGWEVVWYDLWLGKKVSVAENLPSYEMAKERAMIHRVEKQNDAISKMGKNTPRKSAHDEKLPKNGDIYVCTYGPYSTVEFYMVKGTKGPSMYNLVSISKERYDDENVIPDPRDVLTVGKWHRYNPESKSFQIYPHITAVKWDGKPVYTSDFDYA